MRSGSWQVTKSQPSEVRGVARLAASATAKWPMNMVAQSGPDSAATRERASPARTGEPGRRAWRGRCTHYPMQT